MELDWQAVKPNAMILAITLCLLLVFQGISANAGISENEVQIGTPHPTFGYVYWPNGTIVKSVVIPISVTNNRTGETGVILTDPVLGTYNTDLSYGSLFPTGYLTTDTIYVNCTHLNMWAKNESIVGSGTQMYMSLNLVELQFGPELVNSTAGSSITGFNGTITLEIPGDALDNDTVIFGTNSTFSKPGSLASINLGPDGLNFTSPAVLKWSYEGLDLGGLNPCSLKIFTSDGGPWELLPTTVDAQAKLVIVEIDHFSNFSLGGASVIGSQIEMNNTYRGTENVTILGLTISNTDIAVPDILQDIHVFSNCTDDADVSGISLWNDTNSDNELDGSDDRLAGPFGFAGDYNFTGLAVTIPPSTSISLIVALNVSKTATIGNYLDLRIPALGISLNNAGLNNETIDPAGNTTIIQELADPHVVYGNVSNILGPLPYVWVNVTNNRTGSVENLMTDSLGRYEVNLGLMYGSYLDTDEIYIVANDSALQTGWNVSFVDTSQFGEKCDIFVGNAPYASDETPANGTVIANFIQNVTVNITATGSLLDTNTIILNVNGTNYSWPDPVLSYAGKTLTFDTSLAVGSWSMGQVINVTLWSANDTIGNPCLNAPYNWSFSIIMNYVGRPANLTLSNNTTAVMLEWDTVQYADSYNIYRSADKFAAWPWTKIGDNVTTINWTDSAGTYDDVNNYFYIVRAYNLAGEGGNSSMGTKIRKMFTYIDESSNTNINWVSLPYNSNYATISDIIDDIEGGTVGPNHAKFISAVYIWDNSTQGVDGMTGNNFLGWAGSDLVVKPGDAIRFDLSDVMNPDESFIWTIVGTDVNSTQNYSYIDETSNTNINWASVPYGSNYTTLSDIITQIEGGLVGPGHAKYIGAVYVWDPILQGVDGMTGNNFLGWSGNDLIINPGDAIRFDLSNVMNPGDTFSWNPWMMISSVPDIHYYDS